MHLLTLEQTKQLISALDDNEILSFIKEQLYIDKKDSIEVIAELSAKYNPNSDSYHYRIYNVKLKTGKQVEYPISDLDKKNSIQENGIYVPYTFNKAIKKYANGGKRTLITCELILSSNSERSKHNNPLLLNVNPQTLQMLNEIKNVEIIKDKEGNILIEASIVNYYIETNKEKIRIELKSLDKKLDEAEEELEETIKSKKRELEGELTTLTVKRTEVEGEINELHQQYLVEETKTEQEKILYQKILTQIEKKNDDIKVLEKSILDLKKQIEIDKEIKMKNLEKFRSFIKNKADTLLSLEFISQEQYDILMENYHMEQDNNDTFIDFKTDLNGDFSQAISHIQMYLYNQGIIYPKYILEDYFSLIQTNDLIILAGESGSGKTNLVKSFAEAVGGISKIIPVKPNWTSSEDLLGYYNPLEKKYLSTPFLDAILEASRNPDILYFICLDEMNLARVEYYFADFLSKLEERKEDTEIFLYSDTESGHVLSEFNNVLNTIESSKEKFKKGNLVKYIDILKDEEVNIELKRVFGFSDKDSLIKYHSDLRKMISGILDIPSSIIFPKNVRIIGAINIDETTHYLSPKVLDRAHVMKFDSPLLYDREMIADERGSETDPSAKIKFLGEDFGDRVPYPEFDWNDEFCSKMADLTKEYFVDMGVDVGFRTIRQGLNYREMLNSFQSRKDIFINNFILHKILPKFTFDGSSDVKGRKKIDILKDFREEVREIIGNELQANDARNAMEELEDIIRKSPENDGIVNYWA